MCIPVYSDAALCILHKQGCGACVQTQTAMKKTEISGQRAFSGQSIYRSIDLLYYNVFMAAHYRVLRTPRTL